jgi:hypothetical protein
MKNYILAFVAVVSIAAAGCVGFEHKTSVTGPTSTGTSSIDSLAGSWQSVKDASTIIPNPNTCTDFHWNATSMTATTASGAFSASCNGVAFAGTASGTLTGSTVAWNASGTATSTSLPVSPCNIGLSGTAELGTNSIRVPYSGTTCLGAVSGVQILNKN